MNNQTHTYERLTSENAALVLVDHQVGQAERLLTKIGHGCIIQI